MKTKIKDKNESPYSTIGVGTRTKIFNSLGSAKDSLNDPAHPAHGHIDTVVKALGGAYDDASSTQNINTDSPGEIDVNVPARRQGASQAAGASDIAERAAGSAQDLFKKLARGERETFEARRAVTVAALYKAAAKESNKAKKSELERIAVALDAIDGRDVAARASKVKSFSNAGRPLRPYLERHAG